MRTCLSSQPPHSGASLRLRSQIEDSDEVRETERSGKQDTTSLGRTEELPRPQSGSPTLTREAAEIACKGAKDFSMDLL